MDRTIEPPLANREYPQLDESLLFPDPALRHKVFALTAEWNREHLLDRLRRERAPEWDLLCGHDCPHLTAGVRLICEDLAEEAYCVNCLVNSLGLDREQLDETASLARTGGPSHEAAVARHYVMMLEAHYELDSEYGRRMLSLFFDAPLALLHAYVRSALSVHTDAWLHSTGNKSVLESAIGLAWHVVDNIGEADPGVLGLTDAFRRHTGRKNH